MRAFLNAVLAFVGAASLTDLEYASIDQTGLVAQEYSQALYTQLATVLVDRAAESTIKDRLLFFFKAKGVTIADTVPEAKSNIYIGSVLCD